MAAQRSEECPAQAMADVVSRARADRGEALLALAGLIARYPQDGRLHFLRGSLLAADGQFAAARTAMEQAVAVAPGYAIARYQLGLLELSSGDAAAAIRTWAPLGALPAEAPMRLFAEGLTLFAQDDFATAVPLLERGMRNNTELPEMNADIQLLLSALDASRGEAVAEEEPVSAAHLLLQQYKGKLTRQ